MNARWVNLRAIRLAATLAVAMVLAGLVTIRVPVVRSSPERAAVTGSLHLRMAGFVVDQAHGLVFGVRTKTFQTLRTILVLDERTGKVTQLADFGKKHYIDNLVFDPGNEHLIVVEFHALGKHPFNLSRPYPGKVELLRHVIDAHIGTTISTAILGGPTKNEDSATVTTAVVAVDGVLHHGFLINAAGRGIMIDTNTGALLARFQIAAPYVPFQSMPQNSAVDQTRHRLFVALAGPECGPKPCPKVGDELAVVDTGNGRFIRRVRGPDYPTPRVVLDERSGHVFLLSLWGNVRMLDSGSGSPVRRTKVGAMVYDGIAADDRTGRVFVAALKRFDSHRVQMVMLASSNGRILRRVTFGPREHDGVSWGSLRAVVDRSSGHVFVGSLDYPDIWIFDGRNGSLLRTIHLRTNVAYELAVDETTHRVFLEGPSGVAVFNSQSLG